MTSNNSISTEGNGLFQKLAGLMGLAGADPDPAGLFRAEPMAGRDPTLPLRAVGGAQEPCELGPDLRGVLTLMGDPTLVLDANRQIVAINRAAEQALGYKEDELRGRPMRTLFADTPRAGRSSADAMMRACLRKDGGLVLVEVRYTIVDFDQVPRTILTCRQPSVHEQRYAELEDRFKGLELVNTRLRKTIAEMERAQVTSVARARPSHNLLGACAQAVSAPLAQASSYLEALESGIGAIVDSYATTNLAHLRERLDTAGDLLLQTEELAEIEQGKGSDPLVSRRPVAVSEQIRHRLADLIPRAEHRGCVVTVIGDHVVAKLDVDMLCRATRSLVTMAIGQSASSTPISVFLRSHSDKFWVEVGFFPNRSSNALPGSLDGFGPGVILARNLAERLGGQLHMEREIGGRLLFSLEFHKGLGVS